MIKLFKYAVILFLCSTPSSLYSQNNTNLESNSLVLQQAKELYEELRCLVCQNQSLLESEAPLALDLKELIKEKLKEGKTKKGGVGLYRSFVHYDTRGWNARWKGKGVKDYRGDPT